MTRRLLLLLVPVALGTTLAAAQSSDTGLFSDLEWRNIGPANMAGRVTDIEAIEANPAVVYVGAASGGVWKSINAGTTWTPIFTDYGTANIGDIALFQPNPEIVWVGTGESCVRNSVGWGDGIYKSTDGGTTFTNVGLSGTHHISEVVTHPSDPDVVYVAAQGHLWGHSGEHGVYRTTDGGETWRHLTEGLPNDGRTGASDLVMDPTDPNVLYVAMWERIRQPHRFTSGGNNGGIFKSIDGGETWTQLIQGLPAGETGKIGLAVFRRDPRILVAIVEHGFQPQRLADGKTNPDYRDMTKLGTGIYRSEDGGLTWSYLNRYNNRPFYYSHVSIDPNESNRVYVLAGRAQVSEDGGRTFSRSFQGVSGDFHTLWVDPANSDRFYVGNDKGSYATYDRGHTFQMFNNMDIGQFYALTVDNRDPYWVYGGLQDNGNWGGPSNSRDVNGVLNDHWFKFHSGDGFHTTVDPNDWRTVYTEAQRGRLRRLDAVFRQVGKSISPTAATTLNFDSVAPDYEGPRNRLSSSFRFNWSSPLILSPHDSRTVYFGGNHLFKSTDRGDTWNIISPDLSTSRADFIDPESGGLTRDITGAETHATLITIAESPITPGVLWVGTDDGNLHLSMNDGRSWLDLTATVPQVPPGTWISRVEASKHDPATAYVTYDNHRRDDFRPYVFRTTDYGETWTNISAGLPDDAPVYVLEEDPRNPKLLYVGTEFAVHVTVDGGSTWHRLMKGLPTVAIHDLVIHPRDGDLVAATHGRSVWILDDLGPLQQLTENVLAADAHLFQNRTATKWHGVSRGATRGHMYFAAKNPLSITQREPMNSPADLTNSASIDFYLKDVPTGRVAIEITELAGERIYTKEIDAHKGINRFRWNLRFNPDPDAPRPTPGSGGGSFGTPATGPRGLEAAAGTYRVTLTVDGRQFAGTVTVREDPKLAGIE